MLHKFLFALISLFWIGAIHAHGLTITTAGVSLRNQTHLTMRLQYDPLRLWQRVDVENAPASLAAFANLPEAAFEQGYNALKAHLENGLRLRFAAKPVAAMRFRFPSSDEFRRNVRERFMRRMLNAQGDAHHAVEDHRQCVQPYGLSSIFRKTGHD